MQSICVSSPLGPLTLCAEDERLVALLFGDVYPKHEESPVLLSAKEQLSEYFCGKRKQFDLPFSLSGTPFSRAVLRALGCVEYGESITYGSLAAVAGYPRAARAVGNVLHTNPLPIFVPCHRVVGVSGPGNFAWGMEKKLYLMRLEGMDV